MAQKLSLAYDGAPHDDKGALLNEDPKITAGEGRAKASDGALSPVLPNGASRRRWFKWYKENPGEELEGMILPEPEAKLHIEVHSDEPDAGGHVGYDLGGELKPVTDVHTEDELAAAKAEVLGTNGPDDEDLIGDVDPDDDQDQQTISCNFADADLAGIFWGVCGNKGSKVVLAALHPEVKVHATGNPKVLYVTGQSDAAQDAADTVRAYWDGAAEAFKEYKRTSDEYKNRDQTKAADRRVGYQLTKTFFTNYAEQYAKGNVA